MSENSRDKFVRLAENRVNKVIKAIRLVGNLSNRSNYSYTEEDIEKIFSAMNSELKECQNKFKRSAKKQDKVFKLKN